ncbi:MAG TPA: hypothetical protein VFJ85_03215 [Acidimicrobiales bacterium]|nr:hypothetical protein [Acidimicrobiales bacterium]
MADNLCGSSPPRYYGDPRFSAWYGVLDATHAATSNTDAPIVAFRWGRRRQQRARPCPDRHAVALCSLPTTSPGKSAPSLPSPELSL